MKKNYYQLRKAKYEAKIKQLREVIDILIFEPDSREAERIIMESKFLRVQDMQLMFGSPQQIQTEGLVDYTQWENETKNFSK